LSVSEIFVQQTRRGTFLVFVTAAALLYLTGLRMHYPGRWFYISLLMASTVYGTRVAVNFYRWKDPYLHALFLLLPYVAWAIERASQGMFQHGLYFYLFSFFYATGLSYFRRFRRFSPGV